MVEFNFQMIDTFFEIVQHLYFWQLKYFTRDRKIKKEMKNKR